MDKKASVWHEVKLRVLVGAILGVLGVVGWAFWGFLQRWLPKSASAVWHWLGSPIPVPAWLCSRAPGRRLTMPEAISKLLFAGLRVLNLKVSCDGTLPLQRATGAEMSLWRAVRLTRRWFVLSLPSSGSRCEKWSTADFE